MIGQSIAHYKVTARLGAGGMGEVYRASDTKLGRDVALKVLPEAFAKDAQRMARFQREAHVLASLNHPNIAAIYGLEEANALAGASISSPAGGPALGPAQRDSGPAEAGPYQAIALVMELVEGPTLAERIAQGAIPLEEALPIATQIAEALEYAHEKGIVHRDLKPANIKVKSDGKAKVLDFGLAKALWDDPAAVDSSASPTLSAAATRSGIILGTAAYMSPEQARGKAADRRADIWAFGVVLYEMLAGKQAYGGETASDSMASIIAREPDWSALPANVPRRMREMLRRCLTKDPRRRLQAIGDVRIELEETTSGVESSEVVVRATAGPSSARRNALTAVLIVAALAAGAALGGLFMPRPEPAIVARASVPVSGELTVTARNRLLLAISPDGSKIAYTANQRLYLRALDSLTYMEISGTEGAAAPFFSPDGKWVAFFAGGQIKKAPVAGGAPESICTCEGFDASWGANDTILIGTAFSGIDAVPAKGGTPTVVVAGKPGVISVKPRMLPDGRTITYVRGVAGSFNEWETVMRSLEKEDETVVLRGANDAAYVPTGHLLYARLSDLMAVPFDLASRKTTGNPVTVARQVDYTNAGGTSQFSFSSTGTLIYVAALGETGSNTRMLSVERSGKVAALPLEFRDFSDPRVSPDGRLIAAHLQDAQNDVWVADPARGTMSRLSFEAAEDETPAWSPDGRTVAWAATRSSVARGVFRRRADGSGQEELIWSLDRHAHVRDWAPDGKSLVLEIQDPKMGQDIWRLELGEKPSASVFLQTPFSERNSRVSPDGRWIAYASNESGTDEVYVQSFPTPGAKLQVSAGGGDQPVWSRNRKALFYRGGGSIQEVAFEAGSRLTVGKPQPLFPDRFESPQAIGGHTGYDVFPDGRFLMIQSPDAVKAAGGARFEINFVFNWFEELKRVAPAGK